MNAARRLGMAKAEVTMAGIVKGREAINDSEYHLQTAVAETLLSIAASLIDIKIQLSALADQAERSK